MIRRMQKDCARPEDVTEHVHEQLAEQEDSRDANEAHAMFEVAPTDLIPIEHGPTNVVLSETNEAISEETGSNDAARPMFSERPPDADLLIDQLIRSTPACNDNDLNEKLQDASIGLYLSFKPQDAVDSVLARLIVAVSNASMESFGQAAQCFASVGARDLYMRLGLKGSETATKLIELLDRRRGQVPKPLLVGTLNNLSIGEVTLEPNRQPIAGAIEDQEARQPGPIALTHRSADDSDEEEG